MAKRGGVILYSVVGVVLVVGIVLGVLGALGYLTPKSGGGSTPPTNNPCSGRKPSITDATISPTTTLLTIDHYSPCSGFYNQLTISIIIDGQELINQTVDITSYGSYQLSAGYEQLNLPTGTHTAEIGAFYTDVGPSSLNTMTIQFST